MDPVTGFGFICDEIEEFEHKFAEYCGTEYAISITSAGSGLDMAMMALNLEPGDEVIAPAINFRAAPYAIVGQGGKVVLCEADPRTLNADPADIEQRITPRTRAMLITHMNGLSAPMDEYLQVAERHPHPQHGPLKVIGDAARACGAGCKGTKVGKLGWMNIFSLHTMKLMTTLGEGGMITTDDADLILRLRGLRQWGIATGDDVVEGAKGLPWSWGSNYKMTKIQAAVGLVQLRRRDEMLAPRIALAHERTAMLKDVPELTLPYEPPGCDHVYYLYNILVPREWAGERRDCLMKMLNDDYGVDTVIANPPVYKTDPFARGVTEGQCLPISKRLGPAYSALPCIHLCRPRTMNI